MSRDRSKVSYVSTAPVTVADLERLATRFRTRAKAYKNGVVAFVFEEMAEEIEVMAHYIETRTRGTIDKEAWESAFEPSASKPA